MTETNPTPAEVIEVALSGSGGAVKTITDIRLEKMEKQLAELAQANIELRKANAELYAFVSSKAAEPAAAPAAEPEPSAHTPITSQDQPVAAEVQQPPAQPQKDEDAILREALNRLGYKKQETTDNSGL